MRITAVVALACLATCCRTSNHATAWAFPLKMSIGNRFFSSLLKTVSNSNSFAAIVFDVAEVAIVIAPLSRNFMCTMLD